MEITIRLQILCTISLLSVVRWGNAQFYGSYGRSAFFAPITFPETPEYSSQNVVPVLTRSNVDYVPTPQDTQAAAIATIKQISHGSEQFAFDMICAIGDALQTYDANFIISPFSVWSLMLLIAEGASDQSLQQLQKVLRLPNNFVDLRQAYKQFQRLLLVNTSTVQLAVNQALFSDLNRPLENDYASILSYDYEADHIPINFQVPAYAVQRINDHISYRTQGKIRDVVKPEDLLETQLLLISSIFFKGKWKYPFNLTQTREQPFYRENGEFLGYVPMMSQRNAFPFAMISALDATILELPYGEQNRLSMQLIYPRPNTTLTAVFHKLRSFDIERIHHELHRFDNTDDYEETEVELHLPKFSIDSDLELRTVLEHLGIVDIFDPVKAKLTRMSSQNEIYVSRVFHKAIIQVDEVGTVAAAITGGTLSFKQSPVEFVFNRPFGFIITDLTTHTLLFAGQIRHPLA